MGFLSRAFLSAASFNYIFIEAAACYDFAIPSSKKLALNY